MTSFNFLLGVVKTFKNRLLTVSMKQRRPLHRFSLFIGLLSLLISVVALTPPTALAISGKIQEFPIPTATSDTFGITAGPDGNLWFTESASNSIGRITTDGSTITSFVLPGPPAFASDPEGITAGPDGNLWFTEALGNKIGQITTAGVITEFALSANSAPDGITAGPDGNLWFTEFGTNNIGRITTAGVITEFPVPTPGS